MTPKQEAYLKKLYQLYLETTEDNPRLSYEAWKKWFLEEFSKKETT